MADLKPIGSEKLQGMDKIRRIMEIATYNENIPYLRRFPESYCKHHYPPLQPI